ncbi:MAG: amino acid ABC transporter permease [Eggerthellales bacterium]|nr:amino acid ABC transporter permease [Eggerthellales bacterium]
MAADLKGVLKKTLVTALSLSLVITLMPLLASALTQDVTTAKGNETSTGNVLGGVPTRVTWEAVVDKGESVSSVTVQFPEGSDLTADSSARLTVLNGIERLSVDAQAVIDEQNESVTVDFATPLEAGLRVRIETYNACLPNITGEVTLSGSFTRDDGQVEQLAQSPSIEVTQASLAQKIVNWMDEQPFIQAWNSVTVLRLFLEPQLIVSSIPTVFTGWLISLALCLVGFPLAIPIGLAAAFMKISRSKIMHVVAALYTGVIRGTPLFLQIYIAFFGLPLMGINLNQYVLAVMVMAFNSGAYMCEILRAGIQSIPKGQFEASRSLGMNQAQTMFSVIIPQTVRRVIPTMTSEFILLYKDTSLLAAVGVMELMLYSRSVVALTGNMTPYIVAAFFYLVVTLPLIRVVTVLEKRLALADNGGGAPAPKPKRKLRLGAKKQAAPQAASDDQKGADGE